MTIKFGVDIVHIPRFEKTLKKSRDYFSQSVFSQKELEHAKRERIAGIFAAKEATLKALGLAPGTWKQIEVAYEQTGKPFLAKFPQSEGERLSHDLTISHDGNYAIASVVFYA